MGADFDKDDLARLVALEHAFYTIALIAAANFAHNAGCKPGEAVAYFRSSVDGFLHDTAVSKEAVREHLKRLFDNLTEMARLPMRVPESGCVALDFRALVSTLGKIEPGPAPLAEPFADRLKAHINTRARGGRERPTC
jgi:hypothetical protein